MKKAEEFSILNIAVEHVNNSRNVACQKALKFLVCNIRDPLIMSSLLDCCLRIYPGLTCTK